MEQTQEDYLKYLQTQRYPEIAKVRSVLLKGSYISEADSTEAEKAAGEDSGDYVDFLIRQQLLTKTLLGQALAEGYKLPFADLGANPPSKANVEMIKEEDARAMHLTVAQQGSSGVLVVTDRPEAIEPRKVLALFPGRKVRLAYTLPEYLESALQVYERPLETRFSDIIKNSKRVAPEIVDEIIKDALSFRASDIHFEPQDDNVVVRFRVDGALRQAGELPKEYYDNVLNRVKVESGMRIDEHLTSQDGVIQRDVGAETGRVDLRVSLVPTVRGEKVVMRVLGSYVAGFSFDDVGMSSWHRAIIERAIAKPFGMILTVGPTGSGKTTTLYSLLKLLNKPDVNITTIEDPVEYKMAGTNQIQVRENGNMTFAKGLRSIVRQDPDVILVGEIRDRETAEISVNAALTGHLLLSSFHANDAATAVPRLVDMGIEPFLLASTLEVVIAQRLVRRICNQCRYSLTADEAIKGLPDIGVDWTSYLQPSDTVYAGKGCNACSGSGYKGRMPLFELIEITPEMQTLLLRVPSSQEIMELARSQGSRPMFDDGIDKVKIGTTSLAEVLRIVPPETAIQVSQPPADADKSEPAGSVPSRPVRKAATKPRTIQHKTPRRTKPKAGA